MTFLLSILIVLQFCVRASLWQFKSAIWIAGTLAGLSVWIFLPFAWNNSLPDLLRIIKSGLWADNISLLVSLDTLAGIYFAFSFFKKLHGQKIRFNWMQYLPSILLFPSIFLFTAECFYLIPGMGYTATGFIIMVIITTGIPLLSLVFRYFLVTELALTEFLFISSLVPLLVVISEPIGTKTINSLKQETDWYALAVMVATIVICVVSGFLFHLIIKKINK